MSSIENEEDEQRYDESADEEKKVLDSSVLNDPVGVLQPKPAIIVGPSDPVETVVQRMRAERNGCALVVEDGRLVGIFTERDVLMHGTGDTPVLEVMTRDPESIREDDTIATLFHKMVAGQYRHIPIVDAAGAPAGVVSQREAVRYLVGFFPTELINRPPRSVEERPPRNQYGG